MSKKVLILSTSLRNKSNSEMLAGAFAKGAEEAGNEVEMISLRDKSLAFCKGCLVCQKTERCVIEDDAVWIAEKMKEADVIVWATPVYYYGMSGQMKTLIDRTNSLYSADYAFRDIYLLSSAAEDGEGVDEGAVHGLNGWIACYEKARLKGTVFAGGVNGAGEAEGHPALKKAYEMGKAVR